jgi:uncharacterized protein (DUF1684 family)
MKPAVALVPVVLLFTACPKDSPVPQNSAPSASPGAVGSAAGTDNTEEVLAWRQQREDRLRLPESWLSLVGLAWLQSGANSVGSDPASTVPLPADRVPAKAGTFLLDRDRVTFRPEPGLTFTLDGSPIDGEVEIQPDTAEKPSTLALGSLRLFLIRRGDRLGIRSKDRESPLFAQFQGMDNFPIDPKWRVVAKWEPYDPPKRIGVPTILGTIEESPSPGAAVFEHEGTKYRLEPILEPGSDQLFFIFGDLTNGKETYGAGRFLYTPQAVGGTVTLDFNKSYNPPCVFTPWATCPVPPPQNKLALRIEAGELDFHSPAFAH